MKIPTSFRLLAPLVLLLAARIDAAPPAAPAADPFDKAVQAVMQNPSGAAEPQIVEVLRLARDSGRAFAANMAVKSWLARQPNVSPEVMLSAADVAVMAGDLRSASGRYKAFIAAAPAGEERSRAAARLYEVLIDGLGNLDDAYAFMARQGSSLRQSAEARRFDPWFVEQAQARGDLPGMAAMLAEIMAQKAPLELERVLYWDRLDWLMNAIPAAKPEHFAAVPAARRIVGLLRESPARQARYAFLVAVAEYRAASAGRDDAGLAESFKPVAAAAEAYAKAVPTAATLDDVLATFANVPGDILKKHLPAVQACWVASFPALSDAEKSAAINWQGWATYQASPEQWVALGKTAPELFRAAAGTRGFGFFPAKPDPAWYADQASFLGGVPAEAARLANSVAATKGTDFLAGLRHLSANETWYGGPGRNFLYETAQAVWNAWSAFPRQPAATPADANAAWMAWAPEAIARTPAALLQPASAQQYLSIAWNASGADPGDKSKFAKHLRSLDWVPWDEKTRRDVIGPALGAYKSWANDVRKQAAGRDKEKYAQAAALIAPLDDDFKKALDPAVSASADLAKAADPLAGHLARCARAIEAKKLDDYVASARQAYALVKDYRQKKTPWGEAALFWLLANRPKAFDTVDFQCEVIADQMAAWTPDRPNAAKEVIEASLFRDRPRWAAFSIPKDDAPTALKFNAAIGTGILAQLAKGHFDIAFLNAHRATRRGQGGWQDQQAGCDVLAKIIDSKILLKNDAWRKGAGDTTGATAFLQALVRTEYQGLAAKYPVETAFDDMFVEEFQAKPWLDPVFLSYSKDEKKKAAGLAARLFTTFQSLATGSAAPLGFEQPTRRLASSGVITREPTWDAPGVWFWHSAALNAEKPLRDAVLTTATSAWGKTRFDGYAMGLPLLPGDQAVMQQPTTRAEWFRTLATIVGRARAVPYRGNLPNMNALLGLNPATITADEMAVLLSVFEGGTPVAWPSGLGSEHLGRTVIAGLTALGRQADLARLAPQLWRIARDTGSGQFLAVMTGLATGLAKEGRTDIAASIADAGIEMFGTNMPEELRGQLAGVRAEAVLATGNANPVPRGDPRWGVYEAQIAFSAGKMQTAWDRYSTAAPVVQQMYKELDPEFLIWLVRENTATGSFDRARDLAQLLLASAEAVPGSLDTESQAALLVAYADIAMARREYPQARALYERITAAKEFDGTVGKRDAELRVAEVDRLTRQFDSARDLLDKLTRRADKTLQAEAFFQLALVKTDQEEIEEAARDLDQVFMRVPNHVNGRILEGRLNLMRRKYDVASKVKLGTLGDRRTLIPGKPLEVDLEDKNLAVVGKATQIEIRAWTASGDEERFSLFPFGDSKTRFSGQLPTALGSPTKGDRTLQVAGGDTIHYGFADAVAKEAGGDETVSMTVVTDSGLFASSGEILSKEEQQERALERQIRDKLKIDDGLERKISLASARSDDQIKPGNGINVRVIDPDRSTSAQADTLTVRAATSSGDSLVTTLTETGPWTGVFEGTVPTGGSQPTAYASDSTDGNDPNWTIDPQGGTPWIGQPDSVRPKMLSIDLNDNVLLGTMQVTANVPGRKLKDVIVQTSLNGRVFRPVAQWRADGKATVVPWDGAPMMELAPISVLPKAPMTATAYAEYLGRGRYAKQAPLAMAKLPSMAVRMGEKLGDLPTPLAMLPGVDTYVGHWYSGFTVPRKQVRTISLAPAAMKQPVTFLFTIDGTAGKADSPLAITRMLEKGAHRIDVYAIGRAAVPVGFDILVDSSEPPFTVPPPADFFDPAAHPEIAEAYAAVPATIKAGPDGTVFDIAFGPGTRARVVRFLIGDYETDAPAVNTITLTDADGKRVLPAPTSFAELAKNTTLEIIPGDRITIGYEDPATTTKALATQERFLTATFTNADFSAAFVEFAEDGQGGRRADYIPMRRFKPGDTVKVFINDPDMDTSEKPDTISFTARAGTGEPVTLEALETQPHSGIFVGTLFPVTAPPGRPSELTVRPGDDLRLGYVDRENTDPGIPWERVGYVEQIGSEEPELRVFDVASRPLDEKELSELKEKEVPGRKFEEVVPVTREIVAVRPEEPAAPGTAVKVLVDGPLLVELLAPRLAQSPKSAAAIYVQTQSGREKAGRTVSDGEFPLDVPGTIRISTTPSEPPAVTPPAGVRNVAIRGQEAVGDALTDGRYSFLVEKALGPVPDRSLVDEDAKKNFGKPPVLQVRGNDTVYVGFRSGTAEGAEQWIVQPVALLSDVLFDIMDKRYQEPVTGVHVGDSLHVRIIHAALDTTDDKDSITVRLKASNGGEMDLVLTETFGHSGVFKGAARLAYRETAAPQADAAPADGRTLPVTYGETVAISYPLPGGGTLDRSVAVFKGGDAQVVPFTKQFKEPEIAVQTQFTVAEAWFELAKRHRELGQESLARREIAQGKKLLEEAINDYPNTQSRAQADYLLANLAFEFSKDSANEELAKQYAAEAVARFSDIVSSYPDSEYAPKSQFKKALVLEKLGQIDQACEEYVKLSYRYPDNELVAETIARLGQYFLSKGKDFDDRTKSLTDPVEREKVAIQGRDMFKTAAQVFSRLSERFPTHSLAGKTLMLSAQCYLRAGDLDRAVAGFERIYKDPKADKDLAAESMYWAGDVCLQKKDFKNAYRAFKKLTWDYPESKWAKFARGRLTEDALVQAAETEEKG